MLFFPEIIRKVKVDDQKVFLTFDDGPTPGVTDRVLALLGHYKAGATFFCTGEKAEKYPDLFNAIRERGHSIGNHAYYHLNGWKTPFTPYIESVEKGRVVTGSDLFRPPYGKLTIRQWLRLRKSHRIVLWSCISHDYNHSVPVETVIQTVKLALTPGAVIVMHDNDKAGERCLVVLESLLRMNQNSGFEFIPL